MLAEPTTDPLPRVAWRPILAIAAAAGLVHLSVATRYGWHRDDFYYLAAGRHPAWGYPDQPPLVPLLHRLAAAAGGGVLPSRIVVIAVQVATIVVGGLIARELRGGRYAQAIASGCVAGCAVAVGASLFLGTTPTDQLMWALVVWRLLVALRTGRISHWVAVGVAGGIGLENKHTMVVLLGASFIGLLVERRQVLATAGPWTAGAIALALWAPNLWWIASHDWITLDMSRRLAEDEGGFTGALAQLPLLLLVLPGPLIVVLWWRGARWTLRPGEGRPYRWLLVAAVVVVVAITAAGGKPYYSAPMLTPLFALGAVATERRYGTGTPGRRTAARLVAASAVIAPLVGLPFYPPSIATALRPLAREPMETYGWTGFARQVSAALDAHPEAVAVYVSNYGEAGALTTFGAAAGLNVPVVAGQNGYRLWGPPSGTPDAIVAVGEFSADFLRRSWRSVTTLAAITLPDDLENEETEEDATIYLCRDPLGSWADMWPNLTYLS